MDRAEHLAWAKARALDYVERGELPNALASMTSDLMKHVDLRTEAVLERVAQGFDAAMTGVAVMRQWIEGFE